MAVIVRQRELPVRRYRFDTRSMRAAFERIMVRDGERALVNIMTTFDTSPEQTGKLFGVSRQAVEQWQRDGVPRSRLAEVDRVSQVASALRSVFRRERLPYIVRGPIPGLGGHTILETLAVEGTMPVLGLLDRVTSYVPAS